MVDKILYINANKVVVYYTTARLPSVVETKNGTALFSVLNRMPTTKKAA